MSEKLKKTGLMDGAGSEPGDEGEWVTMNGAHVYLDKGQNITSKFSENSRKSGEISVTDRKNANNSKINFTNQKPKEFVAKITEARGLISPESRWRVDAHGESEYSKSKLFTTDGGSCIAIEPDGNIVSVCKHQGGSERGSDFLTKAVEEGGDRLDAFGDRLYLFYTRNGFEPVSWTPFNEEYAPEGWQKEYGKEPIIFYKYTGKQTNEDMKFY